MKFELSFGILGLRDAPFSYLSRACEWKLRELFFQVRNDGKIHPRFYPTGFLNEHRRSYC